MKRVLSLLALAATVTACNPEPRPLVPTGPTAKPTETAPPVSTDTPKDADTPPVTEGDVTEQKINGTKIIVKRVPGAELVAMNLYIRGGVRNWGASDAGVEDMALSVASSGGTTKLDRDAFARRLATMGSDLGAASGNDYGALWAKSLKGTSDETFDMLCDAFLTPAMPASEIDLRRQQMTARLRHEEESPDALLGLMVHQTLFKGHPYENRSVGTMASVTKLTAAQLNAHLEKLRQGSRLLLVVVGDVDPAHIADLAKKRLGSLPRGDYREAPLPGISFASAKLEKESSKLPTTYVSGAFSAPTWREPEFYAAMVAMEHLGFRVFEEVRTKRNLSYAPHASFRSSSSIPIGQLYVSAVDPNAAMQVMFDEVSKLKTQPLTPKQLEAAKSTLLTEHWMNTETTDGQVSALARAELIGGDWRLEKTLIERVKAVSAEQVSGFAKKYIQHLQFDVLGSGAVDAKLFESQ